MKPASERLAKTSPFYGAFFMRDTMRKIGGRTMPTITVEDGTVVTGANSWVSLADARIIADNLGLSLPVDDNDAEIAIVKAATYTNAQEPTLQGGRISGLQTMSWPRQNVLKFGFDVASDFIPDEVKHCQVDAAAAIGSGLDPYPVSTGQEVKREKVDGAVEVEYFQSADVSQGVIIQSSINYLYPFTLDALAEASGLGGAQFLVSRA